ncbi:hypothetical protein KY092_00485 [Natronomonas gomsonensis]|uniref:hypothetical protein n=1 Tax=Natronomonas gomsonensis TaxID=1046043 RepID=UPI0020CA575F|nr:hypothetical protein [Natronomonas gomsonensis]MCY4729028.1 hypothetical protein [Natronomonas gomsonensis]
MRRLFTYALAVVGTFGVLGVGLGLAGNFTLSFFIEQFVDPGTNPLDVTQVALMFLVVIVIIYSTGPIASVVAGVVIGQVLPDREGAASVVVGISAFLGFYLFVALSLFFTFSVLSEYGALSGGGGPLDPAGLVTLTVQVSLPVGLVGLVSAYITSRVSEGEKAAAVPAPEEPTETENDESIQ